MRFLKLLAIFFFVSILSADELLLNGGFEQWSSGSDSPPDYWVDASSFDATQNSDPQYVHSGSYSVRLYLTSTSTQSFDQEVQVNPGETYTATFWVYDNDPAGKARIWLRWYDSNHVLIDYEGPSTYTSDYDGWQKIEYTAQAPAGAAYCEVQLRGYDDTNWDGGAVFYVDDASFSSPAQSPDIKDVTRDPVSPQAGEDITVIATITDDGTITTSRLYYRVNFGVWTDVLPDSTVDSFFYFTVPGQNDGDLIEYYVYAIDNDNNSSTSDTFRVQVGNAVYYVYFQDDTLRKKLGKFIHEAQYSIDIAMYECFTDTIVDSLIAAWNRGVKVRVITDYSYIDRQGTQDLINAGIPVIHEGIGDNSTSHIMHHKFIVRDYRDGDPVNDWIWTGSFNASDYLHADNAIVIKSTELADAFEREFNQMWGSSTDTPDTNDARTGTNKIDVLPTHSFVVGGDSIWVYFSPQDNPIQYLVNLVNRAQSEIGYLIYSFTRDDLGDALISAFQRGVWVGGVHENNASNPEYDSLYNAGVSVYWENLPSQWYSLHDKFMVVDKIFVETGSMNWSNNGTGYNDENVIIIKNPNIAQLYWQEFTERYTEAGGSLYVKEVKSPKTYIKAYPNPFYTVCYFNTQNLEIYDISGRLVKKLGSLSYWDGRDKEGRVVLPGIYFVKKPGKNQLVKVVKIR